MKTRGRAGKVLARLAHAVAAVTGAVITAAVPAVLVMAWGSTAGAMPVGQQFVPTQSSVVWSAVPAGGTEESSPVTVDIAEVAPGDELSDPGQLIAGTLYLYVALHPSYEFGGVPTPIEMPPTEATLVTSKGTVTGLIPPASFGVDASWYFPITANMTAATLEVASFSTVLGNERGDFVTWSFSPMPIDLVGHATSADSALAHGASGNAGSRADGPIRQAGRKGGSTPLPALLGATLGGIAILGAGGAGLLSLTRRRAFYRADREGRVVLTGPPPFIAGATAMGVGIPGARHGIVVKILGWLEVEGTKGTVTAGPLLELIVFLALNPGRSFTSLQLRESIWGPGRRPITSATFRKYMFEFRKAFGTGVVVTDRHRYEMTGVVTSDWDQFQATLEADDVLSGCEEALALVRGPVLNGCFAGKRNSPFEWAVKDVFEIEDRITTVAAELALSCLDLDDPVRAATAVSRGLLCSEINLRLRIVDLYVGAALGGGRELSRRLDAGRAAMVAFPTDFALLEAEARALGWTAALPG